MNTQVGKTFGLALLVAVGILAVMFALGTFSAQKSSADVTAAGSLTITPSVSATATAITLAPGDAVRIDAAFTTNTGIDNYAEIEINLPGFGIPESIDVRNVIVIGETGTAYSGNAADVRVVGQSIFVAVNDDDGDGVGVVTDTGDGSIIIRQSAGVTAPSAAGTETVSIAAATGTAQEYTAKVVVEATVTLDPDEGGSGTDINITGKAFANGTATIYDGDSSTGTVIEDVIVDDGTLASMVAASDLTTDASGQATITIVGADGKQDGATFDLLGTTGVSPATVNLGQTLTISLSDWRQDDPTRVTIRGAAVADNSDSPDLLPDIALEDSTGGSLSTIADGGSAEFTVKVQAGGLRLGTQLLQLWDAAGGMLDSAEVEITALPLTVNPTVVVPGQPITVEGSGFIGTSDAAISTITVGGKDAGTPGGVNVVTGVFVTTFNVPAVKAGTRTVEVTDNDGRVGRGEITVPEPSIVLDPSSGRRGSSIQLTGQGFPANQNVTIDYGETTGAGSARTNSIGSWATVMTVPIEAEIGDSFDVTGTVTYGDPAETYLAEAEHSVDAQDATLTPDTARSGDRITVDGSGFPAYQPVTVTVGTASAINTGANSDGNGDFETTILLPQQAAGPVSVVISVGGKLHTELLTISTGDVVAPSQPTMDAFAGITGLVRVWKYDNATQGWEFYDPDPALAGAVNYMNAASGDIVWISVTEQETFQGSMLYPGWNTHVIQ